MNPFFIVLGSIAVLVVVGIVVVALVGRSLPVAHRASTAAVYLQPRDRVWDVLLDVSDYPAWRGDVKTAERVSERGDRYAWRETGRFGAVEYHVVQKANRKKLVVQMAPEEHSFGGSWTYELADADDDGTRLTITEDGEIYNPVFRVVSRYLTGYHKTQEDYLRALGRKFGEDVTPQRLT